MSASCSACGKPLKDPASVARGIGPKCWTKETGGSLPRSAGAVKVTSRPAPSDEPITDFPEIPPERRKWRIGDTEPTDCRVVRDRDGDQWIRIEPGRWYPQGEDTAGLAWHELLQHAPLTDDD